MSLLSNLSSSFIRRRRSLRLWLKRKVLHMEGESDFRGWSDLQPDVLGLIFCKLEARELVQVIPLVCKSWSEVVSGDHCWKCWQMIDTADFVRRPSMNVTEKVERVLRKLIPRSLGNLHDLRVSCISNHMLSFVLHQSIEIMELRMSSITNYGFEKVAANLGSLTFLEIGSCCWIGLGALDAIRRNCKNLVSLSWIDNSSEMERDEEFYNANISSVRRSLPVLKYLNLDILHINDWFLLDLLSGCPNVVTVDIRGCSGFTLQREELFQKYPNILRLGTGERPVYDSDDSYDSD